MLPYSIYGRMRSGGCSDDEIKETEIAFDMSLPNGLEFINFPFNVDFRIFRSKQNYKQEDVDAVSPLWNDQHQKAIITAIEKDGWFWSLGYERVIHSLIEEQIKQMGKTYFDFVTPAEAKKIQKNPRMWNVERGVVYYLIDYACNWASRQTDARELVRSWLRTNAIPLKCKLCGKAYSLVDTRQTFYRNLKGQIDFCDRCLVTSLYGRGSGYSHVFTEKSRELMLADLRDLVSVTEIVPSSKLAHDFAGRSSYILSISRNRWPDLLRVLNRIRPLSDYKNEFGSWLKALIAANLLDEDTLETSRGIRCIASDGHECHSLAEKIIDDWLYQNQIPHSREPHYPHHSKHNPNGRSRADWLAKDTFIEYFGLIGEPAYDQKMKNKIKLAQEIGLELISISPTDLEDLDNLRHLFLRFL